MMNFSFSQSNLQDYLDCPRRFELHSLMGVRWPGFTGEDPDEAKQSIILGNRFHLLCQQYFSGISADSIQNSITIEVLLDWWTNFLDSNTHFPIEGRTFPETMLLTHIEDRQIIAKFDLIQIHETRYRIYDWKTSQSRPSKSWLEKKIQTTLYPLVLCLAGHNLSGNQTPPLPENVEMVYWFANHPQDPEILPYSRSQFDTDLLRIKQLISEISSLQPGEFHLTDNLNHCRFCTYRSLCERFPETASTDVNDETSLEMALENLAADFEDQLTGIVETWQQTE